MDIEKQVQDFINNPARIAAYNEGIKRLEESGLEYLLRLMGEPAEITIEHPNHMSISAFEQAERRGWYRALNFVFGFLDLAQKAKAEESPLIFGAVERLRNLGYSEEQINEAMKHES